MSMNDFYNFNLELLTKSNLVLKPRDSRIEEIFIKDENGSEKIVDNMFAKASLGSSIAKIDLFSKPILGIPIIFSFFDLYLDSKYGNIQGKSYKQKYLYLPATNHMEIMQKVFFRVHKFIRNAITHSVHSINYKNGMNSIKYDFKETSFSLEISDESLIKLYTATLLLIDDSFIKKRGERMKEGLLKWYYDSIFTGLKIADDIDDNYITECLHSTVIALNREREIIINAEYQITGNYLYIKNSRFPKSFIRDYAISYERDCYVIPEEHLSNNSIQINDLQHWKADSSFLTT